ncbi:hypothetical protein [Methylobacterium sp. J-070]|uniref:hypothetical protein n=1 Tax=Methylobacterium sp. J-070 TaxID=2836650 RepID=UPI001FB901BB|nr:hypothetical protein [Methylobacterium sp. J-070]MCJ2052004.1 hypothetical protein [Methylobacterium sp. J-070]
MSVVYHYTDTGRLPFILLEGQLKPGRNQIGHYPDPDFLWATTSPLGDRTAAASVDACRAGRVRLVRFVLQAEDFEPWHTIVSRFPAWTPELISSVELAAAGKSRPQNWRCRSGSLRVERWLAVETRSYTDKVWRPLPTPWRILPFEVGSVGVQIGPKIYVLTAVAGPFGSSGYVPMVLDAGEAA